MDRQIVYPSEGLRSVDFAQAQQSAMIALGWLGQLLVGTAPVMAGLAIAPASPASLAVSIGPGILSALSVIEATAFGTSLPQDVADPLLKFGVNPTPTVLHFTPPQASGASTTWQAFVVYAAFEEYDGTPLQLPFYNAAAPTQQLNGPGGNAALLPTQRLQRLVINTTSGLVSGTAAAAVAAQAAVPSGAQALYVVTLASGASAVTAANIAAVASAPFSDAAGAGMGIRPGRLLNIQRFQTVGNFTYTPTPGTGKVLCRIQGGGGAGGAATGTGTNQIAAGAGGGAGGYAEKLLLGGFSGLIVTVGAGGVPNISGTGGNGGTSSLGAIASATGGFGGTAGAAVATGGGNFPSGTGLGGYGVGGDINGRGGDGNYAFYTSGSVTSGHGGRSRYGEGGPYVTPGGLAAAGIAGGSPGAGGSGAAIGPNTVSYAGGAGAGGIVEIEEYT